jgi:hypothetical protein
MDRFNTGIIKICLTTLYLTYVFLKEKKRKKTFGGLIAFLNSRGRFNVGVPVKYQLS